MIVNPKDNWAHVILVWDKQTYELELHMSSLALDQPMADVTSRSDKSRGAWREHVKTGPQSVTLKGELIKDSLLSSTDPRLQPRVKHVKPVRSVTSKWTHTKPDRPLFKFNVDDALKRVGDSITNVAKAFTPVDTGMLKRELQGDDGPELVIPENRWAELINTSMLNSERVEKTMRDMQEESFRRYLRG